MFKNKKNMPIEHVRAFVVVSLSSVHVQLYTSSLGVVFALLLFSVFLCVQIGSTPAASLQLHFCTTPVPYLYLKLYYSLILYTYIFNIFNNNNLRDNDQLRTY